MSRTHTYKCSVEFEDLDRDEIVHHHKIACYFERAVVHAYQDDLGIPIRALDYNIVLSSITLECIVAITVNHKPVVHLAAKTVGGASLVWEGTIVSSGTSTILARALIRHGCVNPRTLRPFRWPKHIIDRLHINDKIL